jgi:hypothetical protein
MNLPIDFVFSQSSLQDYVDCRRRFQLRYLHKVHWPALDAQPAEDLERRLSAGRMFHGLIQKHVLGVPVEALEPFLQDQDLRRWWRNYLAHFPDWLPETRFPEVSLTAPVLIHMEEVRSEAGITATLDLLALERDQRAAIVDWKTTANPQTEAWLLSRMQTRVYRYVVAKAGASFNHGRALKPEQISMLYWFAERPQESVLLAYDGLSFEEDERFLQGIIAEIMTLDEGQFSKTDHLPHCQYCRYRSLCDRGRAAGRIDAFHGDEEGLDRAELLLDFDQIAEIEY